MSGWGRAAQRSGGGLAPGRPWIRDNFQPAHAVSLAIPSLLLRPASAAVRCLHSRSARHSAGAR